MSKQLRNRIDKLEGGKPAAEKVVVVWDEANPPAGIEDADTVIVLHAVGEPEDMREEVAADGTVRRYGADGRLVSKRAPARPER